MDVSNQVGVYSGPFKNNSVLREEVPIETYGLCPEFLKKHNIKIPIGTRIFVNNLDLKYANEEKIRKMFSLAGTVLTVTILGVHEVVKANVDYDHPVEAVQAISMFHNQEVFGKPIMVKLEKAINIARKSLPYGMQSIGPGLGPHGKPLKSVRTTIDLMNIREIIREEIRHMVQDHDLSELNQQVTPQDSSLLLLGALQNAATMQQNNLSHANPQMMQLLQMLPQESGANTNILPLELNQAGLLNTNLASVLNVLGQTQLNMQSAMTQPNILDRGTSSKTDYHINHSSSKSQSNTVDQNWNTGNIRDTVVLSYLPPSVTVQSLLTKMRELGEVKLANLNPPGRGVVSFHNPQDASKCIQMFNRTMVDGQIINVSYL